MSAKIREFDPRVLEIPFENVAFDTHSTHGEHALKEYGAWTHFYHSLLQEGEEFEIDDPFKHYVQEGNGRFFRAYPEKMGADMVAGLTITPAKAGYYEVDHLYTDGPSSLVAAACRKMLKRNFFGEFTGIVPYMLPATQLKIESTLLDDSPGLARAVYDWGLVNGNDFVIPMPGIAPFAQEDMSEVKKEQARSAIASHEVTAVIAYSETKAEATYLFTEEYYRAGQYAGKLLVHTEPGGGIERCKDSYSAVDAEGAAVDVASLSTQRSDTTERQTRFLRTLALHHVELGKLILG
jgi:hypothetical protein